MTPEKNISRYTYENTNFQGWRVAIARSGLTFCKYLSDLDYGSEEAGFRAALALRNRILAALASHPENPQEVIAQFRTSECATDKRKRRRAA